MTSTFTKIDRPDNLWDRPGASFYRIEPGKGARISGIVSVGMTSHTDTWYDDGGRKELHCPAMYVELAPSLISEDGGISSRRHPLTVNGVGYTPAYGATVEFKPAYPDDDREKYYQRVTVGGRDYLITSRLHSYDSMTDKARAIVNDVIRRIAAEYVTDGRWHDQRVTEAEYAHQRAVDKLNEAQAEVNKAWAKVRSIRKEVNHG